MSQSYPRKKKKVISHLITKKDKNKMRFFYTRRLEGGWLTSNLRRKSKEAMKVAMQVVERLF